MQPKKAGEIRFSQYILRGGRVAEPPAVARLLVCLMLLSASVAIALWMRAEQSYPGTLAYLPSHFWDFASAILGMLIKFADTCAADVRTIINNIKSLG